MDSVNIAQRDADAVASDWIGAAYYDQAEEWTPVFWEETSKFRSLFSKLNHQRIVDLACGRGRHSWEMRGWNNQKVLVDVLDENIDFCKQRFSGDKNAKFYKNNGIDLSEIESSSQTALFSYDAMVHFSHLVVYQYLIETFRILEPNGMALFHHSNFAGNPGGDYRNNPNWRNFMPPGLFVDYAVRTGFAVREHTLIDWAGAHNSDAITVLQKPI